MLGTPPIGTLLSAARASLLLCALAATNAQAVDAVPPANSAPSPSDVNTPVPDQAHAGPGDASGATGSAGNWHVDGTMYLWFSGAHGNLEAFDYNLGFKASAVDLLSHFRFGITGLGVVRYKRLVLISDIVYIALYNNNTRTLQ